jgi:hypothetical protein
MRTHEIGGKHPSWARAQIRAAALMRGLKPPPPSELIFSAAFAALAILALASGPSPAWGEGGTDIGTGAVFQVDYSNPGLSPSHWTLTIHPDGSGHFRSVRGSRPANGEPEGQQQIDAPNLDRDIRVSADFAERVFEITRQHRLFSSGCESHWNVAFQGWKKLSYIGPEGEGSCEFNYSKDKDIQALGDSLQAVAETILEGARLETLAQHDRLGLDREMEYLVSAARDGRAQQMTAIQEVLERLADDPDVLERVRKRARVLLAEAGTREQRPGNRKR